jgi:carboxymethylenebutenolidase
VPRVVGMTARPIRAQAAAGIAALALVLAPAAAAPAQDQPPDDGALPEQVTFPSADGRTTLVGYLYRPRDSGSARVPAVVMMHGRGGAYSSLAAGRYDAATISQRHRMWGRLWAAQGYIALLVDGFGPRGDPQGFRRGSYRDRPGAVNEVTVRPLDAYGALAYLRTRDDVVPDRIALQGWSNGGSAALASMAPDAPGLATHTPAAGFRAALVLYPGCGLKQRYDQGFAPYAPVRIFQGDADEEVSPRICRRLVARSRARGGDIALTLYPGATHDFDDPGRKRQRLAANARAKADATAAAQAFLARELGQSAER